MKEKLIGRLCGGLCDLQGYVSPFNKKATYQLVVKDLQRTIALCCNCVGVREKATITKKKANEEKQK